ncbi:MULTISPECIES: hypothetical protein [unclassified Clostridium]|uniref:hypothetical protein n=1 Tax=unclassified Clostridium TaxID=2614128 RepID=UPI000312C0C8|nr:MULTISPECIES: hypothetical protein [unclassified Clostridium]MBN1052026.1 hypothetical protein [Clostridium botulinum]MBN1055222.1 hypothetical protein [Clostridium botulinum]
MRKSKIVVALGGFVVMTALLCIGSSDKIYKKQVHFNTTDEILNQLENNKIIVFNEKNNWVASKQFSECLSLRKRIAGSAMDYETIRNIEKQELDEEETNSIKKDYIEGTSRLSNYKVQDNLDVVRIKADTQYLRNRGDSLKMIDIILVDEGDGKVIDYISIWDLDDNGEIIKENHNDKG